MLQVPLQVSDSIEGAISKLLQSEDMTGENQYESNQGLQDAQKFLRLKRLPPILQISLNRFGLTTQGIPKKINSFCEFSETLNLSKLL